MHSFAWFLNDLFFERHFWVGFLIEAVIFFVVAAVAGLLAYRAMQAGAPPVPAMAIEEGKRIKQTLESGTTPRPAGPRAERALMANEPEIYSGAGEPVARRTTGAPGRTSEQIRADIERQRGELSQSVELLRGRVAELTDWRRQVREHRREIVIGAAVVGFAVGLRLALRRRG